MELLKIFNVVDKTLAIVIFLFKGERLYQSSIQLVCQPLHCKVTYDAFKFLYKK